MAAKKVREAHDKNLSPSNISPATRAQKEKGQTAVKASASKTQAQIVESAGKFKVTLTTALDSIVTESTNQLGTLREIQDAIAHERQNLQELYDISAQAGSLFALIEANEAERAEAEEERQRSTKAWEDMQKARDELTKKDREDQAYQWKLKVRNEEDAWKMKLQQREAEHKASLDEKAQGLNAAIAAFTKKEERLAELEDWYTKTNAAHTAELKYVKDQTTTEITRDLNHGFAIERMALKNQNDLQVREIQALAKKVEELNVQNQKLQSIAADATNKVQTIAEKAVESASRAPVNITNGAPSAK